MSLMNLEIENSPENKNESNIINIKNLSTIMELEPVLEDDADKTESKKPSKKSAKNVESSKSALSNDDVESAKAPTNKVASKKAKVSEGVVGRTSRSRSKIL